MPEFAYFALFGVPLAAAIAVLAHAGSVRAVAPALVGGWLAMPLLSIQVAGLPPIDKESMLGTTVLIAAWLGRRGRYPPARLHWFDLPMIVWCAVPLASSIDNDLGAYDGIATSLRQIFAWGIPYAIGRLVLVDREALMVFGRTLLLGAAVYAPFCLLESRLAPQLHTWIYGLPGRSGWETVSFYGPLRWKATVFLQSSLELTPLMGAGFLFGSSLWRVDSRAVVAGFGVRLLTWAALVATLMGKSLGGFTLTVTGALTTWSGGNRGRILLLLLTAIPPVYVGTRAAGAWSGTALVEFVEANISARRADSFHFRLINEDLLLAKAMERPWLGWGGWGRNRVNDEEGRDITTTDGLWVMALGCHGLVGMISWMAAMLVPVWLVAARMRYRSQPDVDRDRVLLVAATIVALHTVDCLVNAMVNPVYGALAGGIGSVVRNDAGGKRNGPQTAVVPPDDRRARHLRPRRVRALDDAAGPGAR
jgi:hypothetical protein